MKPQSRLIYSGKAQILVLLLYYNTDLVCQVLSTMAMKYVLYGLICSL